MKKSQIQTLFIVLFLALVITSIFPLKTFAQDAWGNWPSSFRRKINKLGDEKVLNVPLPILFGLTPDNLTRNFGDPRPDGRTHEGLDILAPRGSLIVTPTDAVVIQVGYGDSAGNYVYTANPGGETFAYMHMDKMTDLTEGDEIKKGALIGYVGNTGNAAGGVTHLHFEIRDGSNATDPFPRLRSIFPLADKIEYLSQILDNSDDEKNLAEFVVKMYRSDMLAAKKLDIVLPRAIEEALKVVVAAVPTPTSAPNGDLKLGSRGTLVVALQNFLISKNIGTGGKITADGSFGPMTQKALAEYQASVGIKPATGYYGPITRAYVLAHS
ncbi:MAG: peptidoglycan DD-metalloendopeptidase family protein [Patescibacteria group bacterium]